MTTSDHMNYLALNQNILGKPMVFGRGFEDGSESEPCQSVNGVRIYLNGLHAMPDIDDIQDLIEIGTIHHPVVMHGVPDASGELTYEFGICEDVYFIFVRLEIDEEYNGQSEPAIDVLALTHRSELPSGVGDDKSAFRFLSKEMLLCHFERLLEFYESKDDLEEWEIEGELLNEIVEEFFELKSVLNQTNELLLNDQWDMKQTDNT